MANSIRDGKAFADRIVACIDEADAAGLHVVAAHLDAALYALQGSGRVSSEVERRGEPLH